MNDTFSKYTGEEDAATKAVDLLQKQVLCHVLMFCNRAAILFGSTFALVDLFCFACFHAFTCLVAFPSLKVSVSNG